MQITIDEETIKKLAEKFLPVVMEFEKKIDKLVEVTCKVAAGLEDANNPKITDFDPKN